MIAAHFLDVTYEAHIIDRRNVTNGIYWNDPGTYLDKKYVLKTRLTKFVVILQYIFDLLRK